ncbi:unnamed protein product [Cyprideis torosa]|uniref:Spen paralogue and orthologue SPOC C-terminal domain-containing protein n=1 Tax=Cyprideis torosa TaxID=163714 RepID=A0A7R8W784_9CRUS|nr:unnamed protein product [Cyprideis torosa]CAG0887296.1 unnamed protein product [Cyprideis torosa]
MVSLAPSEAAGSCDQLCAVTEMELRRESEQEKKVKEEISHVMEEVEEEIHSEDKLAAPASSLGEDPFGNPILWKGIIHSTEIAPPTFPVSASNLGGLCDYLTSDLPEKPERLTMVGKIEPDRVWKYIDKVRISKEIAILMLQTEAEHSTTYQELFDWMHSKRRYCVVQGHSSMVKDFYLVPIPKGSSGPTEMTNYLSLEGSRAFGNGPQIIRIL